MTDENTKKLRRLKIIEAEDGEERCTTQARRQLYHLIANFRRNAEVAESAQTRTVFKVATEIMASLANLIKQHERSAGQSSGTE